MLSNYRSGFVNICAGHALEKKAICRIRGLRRLDLLHNSPVRNTPNITRALVGQLMCLHSPTTNTYVRLSNLRAKTDLEAVNTMKKRIFNTEDKSL